jgi:N-acetylglucosaminyldiphosphoundecaprenol N-acetyl-beta-D-mannosaminyltransferase
MTRAAPVVEFGPVRVHAVSAADAVDLIAVRAAHAAGGFVLTPNVAHVALSARSAEMAAAYRRCFLSLADGMPLVLLARLLRLPLREKVSGSDIFPALMARCAREGLRVFFIGATPSACEAAIRKLRAQYDALRVVGYDASRFDLESAPEHAVAVLRRARDAGARLIVVCLPMDKQLMLARFQADYHPAVGIGAGAALSFYAGEMRRAPAWMSRCGLEWLYRLAQEPRRLWRRYLLDSRHAVPVFAAMVKDRLAGRTRCEVARLA